MLVYQRVKGTVVLLPNIEKKTCRLSLDPPGQMWDAFQEDHLNWMFRSHPPKDMYNFTNVGKKKCNKQSPSHHRFYRWYGSHSLSWVVYGIVLPTSYVW